MAQNNLPPKPTDHHPGPNSKGRGRGKKNRGGKSNGNGNDNSKGDGGPRRASNGNYSYAPPARPGMPVAACYPTGPTLPWQMLPHGGYPMPSGGSGNISEPHLPTATHVNDPAALMGFAAPGPYTGQPTSHRVPSYGKIAYAKPLGTAPQVTAPNASAAAPSLAPVYNVKTLPTEMGSGHAVGDTRVKTNGTSMLKASDVCTDLRAEATTFVPTVQATTIQAPIPLRQATILPEKTSSSAPASPVKPNSSSQSTLAPQAVTSIAKPIAPPDKSTALPQTHKHLDAIADLLTTENTFTHLLSLPLTDATTLQRTLLAARTEHDTTQAATTKLREQASFNLLRAFSQESVCEKNVAVLFDHFVRKMSEAFSSSVDDNDGGGGGGGGGDVGDTEKKNASKREAIKLLQLAKEESHAAAKYRRRIVAAQREVDVLDRKRLDVVSGFAETMGELVVRSLDRSKNNTELQHTNGHNIIEETEALEDTGGSGEGESKNDELDLTTSRHGEIGPEDGQASEKEVAVDSAGGGSGGEKVAKRGNKKNKNKNRNKRKKAEGANA